MMEKFFEHTAFFDGKIFVHFGIHETTAKLYGHEPEEIVKVKLEVSDNQEVPPANDTSMVEDYWGWYDNKKQRFTLVYAKRFLLNMCFPYGIEATEKTGEGKAYRLKITKI